SRTGLAAFCLFISVCICDGSMGSPPPFFTNWLGTTRLSSEPQARRALSGRCERPAVSPPVATSSVTRRRANRRHSNNQFLLYCTLQGFLQGTSWSWHAGVIAHVLVSDLTPCVVHANLNNRSACALALGRRVPLHVHSTISLHV